jgi:hypothetical protein
LRITRCGRKSKQQLRRERIAALEAKAQQWAGKLDGQDAGVIAAAESSRTVVPRRGLYHEVSDAHWSKIIKVDLKSELFTYSVDEAAQARLS